MSKINTQTIITNGIRRIGGLERKKKTKKKKTSNMIALEQEGGRIE